MEITTKADRHQKVRSRDNKPSRFSGWAFGTVGLALLLALPVLVVTANIFVPAGDIWRHLGQTVLQDYVVNSLALMAGVTVGTLALGLSCAWLASMCQFPGHSLFEWALLLPMALPAYIIAYTYTGLLDFSGPVQTSLREVTGWGYGDYWFPEIRSLGGAIVMMSLVLYPYVYLMTRAAFLNQSLCVLDVSRTLGNGPWRTFATVALPLARPAIVAGLSLALMETLADYGTVQYFGLQTFTTGIFRTWYGLDNAPAAAQLATALLGFVFILVVLEQASRRRARFHQTSQRHQDLKRIVLRGPTAWAAVALCTLAVGAGFALPAGQLLWWSMVEVDDPFNGPFFSLLGTSILLAMVAAVLSVALALFLGYGRRLESGTMAALIFAYLVRFLAVSLQAVNAGLDRIKPSLDEAGRSLGYRPSQVVRLIHMPLLRGSLLTALLLVFVDVLKELPATLILRPFNVNTLAVRAHEMASDERLADAGPAALAIVVAGILPVILLSRSITRSRRSR
jgi:iron(III) transport system permease protein